MNPIDQYTKHELVPVLLSLHVPRQAARTVREDIAQRLLSLLALPEPICKTLLFFGLEEAYFYEPLDAPLDVKCLVVCCVRNSDLENISSTKEAAERLGAQKTLIYAPGIKFITSQAISFFSKTDIFNPLWQPSAHFQNTFSHLPNTYPLAWTAFDHLSRLTSSNFEDEYSQLPTPVPTVIETRATIFEPAFYETTLSGMDPHIDPVLQTVLEDVAKSDFPYLLSDSLKTITRNFDKLLKVVEHVLRHNKSIVTNNYYISNGYVSRRKDLLRPVNLDEAGSKIAPGNQKGLSAPHAKAIELWRHLNQ